jgi:NAD(P)-dependent dehydrogenase (short-subunit alcohol dehydrogenase family)
MRDITDKVAVVTGAGSGIGRATALALASHGAHIALCDLNEDAARDTAGAVATLGGRASVHRVDVSSFDEMQDLADGVVSWHGAVDIVVNNAGIGHGPTPIGEFVRSDFERVMDVNFWGVVNGSLAFLPHLRTRAEANIVNVGSYASLLAVPRMGPYVSSKFAVRGFSEGLRAELRSTSVRVALVCPGGTRTAIMTNSPVVAEHERQSMQRSMERGFLTHPDRVAAVIIRAVRRDRGRALVGPDTRALDWLARTLPASYSRLIAEPFDRYVDKALLGPTARR